MPLASTALTDTTNMVGEALAKATYQELYGVFQHTYIVYRAFTLIHVISAGAEPGLQVKVWLQRCLHYRDPSYYMSLLQSANITLL